MAAGLEPVAATTGVLARSQGTPDVGPVAALWPDVVAVTGEDISPWSTDGSASSQQATEERFTNYKRLANRVIEVFGDGIKASKWLSLANKDFAGKTPLQLAQENDYDVIVLEPVLNRIEQGIDF